MAPMQHGTGHTCSIPLEKFLKVGFDWSYAGIRKTRIGLSFTCHGRSQSNGMDKADIHAPPNVHNSSVRTHFNLKERANIWLLKIIVEIKIEQKNLENSISLPDKEVLVATVGRIRLVTSMANENVPSQLLKW